jgi:glyceraldehyde 3-phosphate dehydrogenase
MRRVAINGLGRIGRMALRHLMQTPQAEIVALNDVAEPALLAHLLRHDSAHGAAAFSVAAEGAALVLEGRRVPLFSEPDPARIPFGATGAEVVLECTGRFTRRDQAAAHLRDGVSHVLISAASEDADHTVVMGVNEGTLDPAARILSNASGTTQGLAPLVKVLDDAFGLEYGFATAVHSYTNDQRILDLPHGDLRRARAAAASMIPTRTSAVAALARVLPHLAGRLDGLAVRVATPDVSLVDLTATLRSDISLDGVHAAFRAAAEAGPLAPYLDILPAELVSVDLVGSPASAIYDPYLTKALGPRMVKVFAWYDNEWGYAARLKDLCLHILEHAQP